MKNKLRKNQGITIISLVVTIIVLLVLAGVTVSMTFSKKGIYNRAKQTADKYDEAKAYEILELTLGEAQMKKYTEGLTDEELSTMINEIGSEMERNPDSDYHNVIVGGYIFEIDRSVPEIVKEVGPADGIVITAKVSGDGGWTNGTNVNITVTGTITTYGAGKITSSSATNNGVPIAGFPTKGGDYTISGIASDTKIIIMAENSKGREERKEIPIQIKVDKTAPSLSGVSVTAEDGKKIRITANAEDTESGVKQINYSVYPETVNSAKGSFMPGDEVVLTAENVAEYTITFTAEDNVGNKSADQVEKVTTKADSTPPTFRNVRIVANGMIIRTSVEAEDLSGIKQLSYTVNPSTVTPSTGTLNSGEEVKLTATEEKEYTVTFTATDNAGNVATTTATATTKNKITVAEAKAKINSSNIKDYIGTIVEYDSPAGGDWQVFYYDGEEGKYGEKNTIYLKCAGEGSYWLPNAGSAELSAKRGENMMKRMNPLWASSGGKLPSGEDVGNCYYYLYDVNAFAHASGTNSSYTIGSPSFEMLVDAINLVLQNFCPEYKMKCFLNGGFYDFTLMKNNVDIGKEAVIPIPYDTFCGKFGFYVLFHASPTGNSVNVRTPVPSPVGSDWESMKFSFNENGNVRVAPNSNCSISAVVPLDI